MTIAWTGPAHERDYISIDEPGADDRSYGQYAYATKNPVTIQVPDEAGDYVVRYHLGQSYRVIGQTPLIVRGVEATLEAPDRAQAGGTLEVRWTGPNGDRDYISHRPRGRRAAELPRVRLHREGQPGRHPCPRADRPLRDPLPHGSVPQRPGHPPPRGAAQRGDRRGTAERGRRLRVRGDLDRPGQSGRLPDPRRCRGRQSRLQRLCLHGPGQPGDPRGAARRRIVRASLRHRPQSNGPRFGPDRGDSGARSRLPASNLRRLVEVRRRHRRRLRRHRGHSGCLGQHAAEARRRAPHRDRQELRRAPADRRATSRRAVRDAGLRPPRRRLLPHRPRDRPGAARCRGGRSEGPRHRSQEPRQDPDRRVAASRHRGSRRRRGTGNRSPRHGWRRDL